MKEKHVIDDFELVNRMRKTINMPFPLFLLSTILTCCYTVGLLLQTETNAKILFKAYFWNFGRKEQN